jgi:hypothetical protein
VEVHPTRLKRWEALNEQLEKNRSHKKRKGHDGSSTPYSSVNWGNVGLIFQLHKKVYTEIIKDFPEEAFDFIMKYLTIVIKSYGSSSVIYENEAKKLHLIAPVIFGVVSVIPGVTVEIEQDLDGKNVKAHGHFEFSLVRGEKRVCIVEAKKDDFQKGFAQSLLGCEVIADIDHVSEVYSIVTNFSTWVFLKSLDDRILSDENNFLSIDDKTSSPQADQLRAVVGKIFSLLS